MSLTSIYDLSTTADFQKKVAASAAKQALAAISNPDPRIANFAKVVVGNLPYYNERLYLLVATITDSQSTDQQIDAAVASTLISMVP